jgi:hypothetical protein
MEKGGSCGCGKIEYKVLENPKYIGYCHCEICQKIHGSAFSAFAAFPMSAYSISEGAEYLSYYQSSRNVRRSFCSKCGSSISFEHKLEKDIWIAAGTLDFDPGVKARSQMFTDSKACWHEINENLEQHKGFPSYT